MKKIMMTKYGFERWQEEDFSDDGNRFYCYKVGTKVRVSKLVSQGRVYISARIDHTELPYEIYSKLPSYQELDRLNGISLDSLTEADLIRLYDACVSYEQEFNDAKNTTVFPTLEEITDHCKAIQANRRNELSVVEHLLKTNIIELVMNLSEYRWKDIKRYYNSLVQDSKCYDPDEYPAKILGTSHSFDFCKSDYYKNQESFYYRELMEIIKSAVKGDE